MNAFRGSRVAKLSLVCVVAIALTSCNSSRLLGSDVVGELPALAEEGNVYSLIAAEEGTAQLRQAAASLGYVASEDIALDSLGLILVRYDLPEGVTGAQAIMALENAVPTSVVGVNHAYRLQQSSSSYAPKSYANRLIDWPAGGCPARVTVGMIDGQVNVDAPALAQTRVIDRNFGSGSPESAQHGTEVASVLADPSRVRSLNLYAANVMQQAPDGLDVAGAAGIVQALDWLASQDVKVVNVSLAGPRNKLLKLAVDRSTAKGMVLVAAAGNQGPNANPQFPAAFDNVIAVTALDAGERVYRNAVRGSHIEIAAPGVDVFIPSSSGGRYVTGTSIAVPFVVARMAASADMNFGSVSKSAIDLGQPGKDLVFGHGLLQARNICLTG